jgi:hypothetical protein
MYKNIIKIILFSLLILDINKAYAITLEDVSIIVPSCDKYSGLWEPFFSLLFKNWPALKQGGEHQNIPIYFISNKKEFNHPRVQNIKFPNEISWSDNMIEALSQIKTKYVLYLQEDYFLTEPINEKLLVEILQYMANHDAAFVQVAEFSPGNVQTTKQSTAIINSPNLVEVTKHSEYKVNLQAGLWEKDIFLWLVKPGENMFQFETNASKRSEGMYNKLFFRHLDRANDPIKYLNAAKNGALSIDAVNYLHSQGINFDPKAQLLPLDTDIKVKLIRFKRNISWTIYGFIQKHKKTIANIMF